MKKIDKIEVVRSLVIDGYEKETYLNVSVPDDFEELDMYEQEMILEAYDSSSTEFEVRKVLGTELYDLTFGDSE